MAITRPNIEKIEKIRQLSLPNCKKFFFTKSGLISPISASFYNDIESKALVKAVLPVIFPIDISKSISRTTKARTHRWPKLSPTGGKYQPNGAPMR